MNISFGKFAGACAIVVGVAGLLYLVALVLLKNLPTAMLPSILLLLVGLFASATTVALYQRVRAVDEGFALWALLLGIIGASGAAIHAAFDVSNNLHPPTTPFDYPSPIDPRGYLTFAVAGLAAIVVSWLLLRGNIFSRGVAYLGIASGLLLIALYIAYLIILSASNAIVLVLILASGLAQPIWYLWIGWQLWQAPAPAASAGTTRPAGKRR